MDYAEWQANLQCIKHRYLLSQYGECASRCLEMLKTPQIHPTHAAYLHFYAGLSHELIAEPKHNLHPTKLHDLRHAAFHYQTAAAILPAPPRSHSAPTRMEQIDEQDDCESMTASTQSSSPIAAGDQPSSAEMPTRDPVSERATRASLWPPTPPGLSRLDAPPTTSRNGLGGSPFTLAEQRYHEELASLLHLLQGHIRWISLLQQEAEAAQTEARDGGMLSGPMEPQDGEVATSARQARLEEGRARGWRRDRFDARRVDRLIQTALRELDARL